ncbi:MAG: hypothetical protein NXI35_15690 [bacterium]|nr:hypothetical protein [bacterium]
MAGTAAHADAFVIAPEPTDWLRPVVEALESVGTVRVFAPWALPDLAVRLAGRVGFARRRDVRGLPGARPTGWFTAAELAARAYAGGKAARAFANRVRLRSLVDRAAARELDREAPRLVIAPSFAARSSFAAGRRNGATCLLVEDMPDFDTLVDGLDTLAERHPDAHFLRNHRPRSKDHARQRAERWQAHAVAVRGRVAWHRLGAAKTRVQLPRASTRTHRRPGPDVCFAGPALARAGSTHLQGLLDALPGRTIRVRPGPCNEPACLADHPRLRVDPGLDGAGVVLSLGPLESHPVAVALALDTRTPIVGTLASTGLADPRTVEVVDPRDATATAAAIEAALAGRGRVPRPWTAPLTLRAWLRAQYSRASSVTA